MDMAVARPRPAGETIRWTIADSEFGPLLLAASARGICRLTVGGDPSDLRRRFPAARIERADDTLDALVAGVRAQFGAPARAHDLPLDDTGGTAFQRAVWRALADVPAGTTVSYAELAALAGWPGAARAAGSACGANPIAVLIPCHRARRGDGSPGGYAWGLGMKAILLAREAEARAGGD